MSNGFVMVPHWLARRKPSGSAILVYIALAGRGTFNPGSGRYEECRPSIPTVAADTDLSETTVRKAIKELIKLGGLESGGVRRGEDGGQIPTVYRVVFGDLVPPAKTEGGVGQPDTPRGVSNSEGNQEPSTKNPSALQRGTHLPPDWTPSPALLQWFVTELVEGGRWSLESRTACQLEQKKFMSYWLAASGQAARKRDWDRAWQNWMLKEFGRRRIGAAGGQPAGPPQTFKQMDRADEQAKQRRAGMIDAALAHIQRERPDLDWQTAYDLARQGVDDHLAAHPNGLNGSSASGYIEAEVIESADEAKEVAAS